MLKSIVLIMLLLPLTVWADSDQNRSRMAMQAGEIMPLRQVLELVEKNYPGQVLEVELEREHEEGERFWIYEIKLLNDDGRLQKLLVDAKTGEVLGVKQRPMKSRPMMNGPMMKWPMINKEQRHAHPNR